MIHRCVRPALRATRLLLLFAAFIVICNALACSDPTAPRMPPPQRGDTTAHHPPCNDCKPWGKLP